LRVSIESVERDEILEREESRRERGEKEKRRREGERRKRG
jgi:hypothetical protein